MIQVTQKFIAQVPQEDTRTSTRSLKEQPANMLELPDDVLANILIRLPAKQLAQLRRVSKAWNALLSEPHFIKTHFGHSNCDNNDEVLLVFFKDGFSVNPSRSPDIDLTSSFIKLPSNFPSECTVIGSVNGLICFSRGSSSAYDSVIHIWNPSLSALMTLPPYTSRTPPPCYGFCMEDKFFFRFGFDPKCDDYKVVLFTTCFNLLVNKPAYPGYLEVEVYSTKKGSWNLITVKFSPYVEVLDPEDHDCLDGYAGYLHWLCEAASFFPKGRKRYETIVAFDLSLETFREIPFPDSIMARHPTRIQTLGVLAGKLCVMSSFKTGEAEVWVMDEYGVAESWVKNHVFSEFRGHLCQYGFTLNNEFLFQSLMCEQNRLALYDPVAAKVKYFKDILPQDYERGVQVERRVKVVSYVDSLVWPAPTKPYVT